MSSWAPGASVLRDTSPETRSAPASYLADCICISSLADLSSASMASSIAVR